jgi:hypothetical protein
MLPGAPTIVSVAPGDGSASVSFVPPSSDGGGPITGYIVACALIGGGTVITASRKGEPDQGVRPDQPRCLHVHGERDQRHWDRTAIGTEVAGEIAKTEVYQRWRKDRKKVEILTGNRARAPGREAGDSTAAAASAT